MAPMPPQVKKKDKPEKNAPDRTAARWCTEIDRYERGTHKWRTQAEKVTKIYLDEDRVENGSERRFALLWANIETQKPALYARPPVVVVSRRHRDSDPIARKASEVLERCANTQFDLNDINDVMEPVRDDRLLVGRGTAWVRYEAQFEDIAGPDGQPQLGPDGKPQQKVASEKVCNEFVHWSDFGHRLARTWGEVTAVWRRVYLIKEKVKERFGDDVAKELSYTVRPDVADKYSGSGTDADAVEPQTVIYEIWDKLKKQTIWLSKDKEKLLEQGDPPLNFRHFFPCPRPCYGTKATKSLIPKTDYRYYQDQAEEINDLTEKISALTGWLRLKGLIPAGPSSEGADAIEQLLRMDGNQVLVKVQSWAGFAEKGGVKGLVEWLPIDQVVVALREAITARRELKNDVFELIGISDILRGASDPNETLGAQQIKAQSGSRRISTAQRELARFARDMAELNCEVIAEVFQPETISEMSGFDLSSEPPPQMMMAMQQMKQRVQAMAQQPPQMGPNGQPMPPQQPDPAMMQQLQQAQAALKQFQENKQVLDLLRDEKTRGFRIEVETDSTIEPDEQREKQSRTEFITAVGEYMKGALPAAQAAPQLLPVLKEMLLFLVRGFRAGRSMEDVIERSMEQLMQAASAPKPPDPETMKAKHDMELEDKRFQHEVQSKDQEMAMKKEEATMKAHADSQPDTVLQINGDAAANLPALLGEALQGNRVEMTKVMTSTQEQLAQALMQLAQIMAAPKWVIRGPDNRIVGAETAMNGNGGASTPANLQQALQALMQAASAPRRVSRGPDNQITGSEPVLN